MLPDQEWNPGPPALGTWIPLDLDHQGSPGKYFLNKLSNDHLLFTEVVRPKKKKIKLQTSIFTYDGKHTNVLENKDKITKC